MQTCGELIYSFVFGHYSSYAKVAEVKKTLRVEQFAEKSKEPDLVRLSTRSPDAGHLGRLLSFHGVTEVAVTIFEVF